jgi:hypothetical protein
VEYPTEPVTFRRPFVALFLIMGAACSEASSSGTQPSPTSPVPPTMGEAAIQPAGPGMALEGACVNGFTAPGEADPVREEGLRILARALSDPAGERVIPGDLEVEEMRYFEGPESPPSVREYIQNVRRWYVKASLRDDPEFAGRFLVERRSFGPGLAAVAPFDSEGFASPDWIGFQYEGEEAERQDYNGLPGTWAGTPYDFVRGKTLDRQEEVFGFPGLPVEVIGCLAGT